MSCLSSLCAILFTVILVVSSFSCFFATEWSFLYLLLKKIFFSLVQNKHPSAISFFFLMSERFCFFLLHTYSTHSFSLWCLFDVWHLLLLCSSVSSQHMKWRCRAVLLLLLSSSSSSSQSSITLLLMLSFIILSYTLSSLLRIYLKSCALRCSACNIKNLILSQTNKDTSTAIT